MPNLNLPQLSYDGLAEKVAAVKEHQENNNNQQELKGRIVLATLSEPTTKTDSVKVGGGQMIVVGTKGHYTFDFDVPETANDICYLDLTYASEDLRKLVLTLNGNCLQGDFCAEVTGGFGPGNYITPRYGPFPLATGKNTLHVTTNKFWFPHVHEIKVVDAVMADQLPAEIETKTWDDRTWIAPPSQPLRKDLAEILLRGFCSVEHTQEPNPNFVPDPNFYNAVNCDGLWVLASKECGLKVLHRACELVCRYVPVEIRRACLQWRAPNGRPIGPFRLIILDNKTNQKAGDCPDLPSSWGGRNNTNNPACFTCAGDLDWADDRWGPEGCHGSLTVHELTHLIDMVVRQQIDPYFMQQVDEIWQANRETYKKAYAYSCRHEYLAEIATLYVGCNPYNFTIGCSQCNAAPSGYCDYAPHKKLPPGPEGVEFRNKSDLLANDPDGYELLKTFLIEIYDRESDRRWWEDQA